MIPTKQHKYVQQWFSFLERQINWQDENTVCVEQKSFCSPNCKFRRFTLHEYNLNTNDQISKYQLDL